MVGDIQQVGFLTYDLQPFTEDCVYRVASALPEGLQVKAFPVFFHPNQEKSRIPYRPSFLKGKHLGVNVAGSTPEGFASNINWGAILNCVRESDIIILYGLQGATALLVGLLSLLMRRTVISVNQTLPVVWERKRRWWVRWLKQWLLNRCKYHIYQTQAAKEVLTSVYNIDEKQLFYAPFEAGASWFDGILQQQRGCRDEVRQKMSLTDEVLFLFVGNLHPFKGVIDLIRAASLIPRDTKFCCIFIGPEVPGYQFGVDNFLEIARKLEIEQKIRFLAPMLPEELAAMYWAADAVIQPTRRDTFLKVLVEGALASKPLITTNSSGAAGLIAIDGDNGFVVEPGDIHSLAEGMNRLLDSNLRKEMGRRSRKLVEKACNPQAETTGFVKTINYALRQSKIQ